MNAGAGEAINDDLSGTVKAALEIATERRATLAQMRKALERGDDAEALRHARTLCGLADEPSPSEEER
jgi:hypothetical protein